MPQWLKDTTPKDASQETQRHGENCPYYYVNGICQRLEGGICAQIVSCPSLRFKDIEFPAS
jgi:hypothetical protein